MTKPLLQVDGASKRFCPGVRRSLLYGALDILAEFLPTQRLMRLRRGEFWALDDVSLQLHAGEAVAVLGSNGAGKSTLLKVLAGLLPLDRGRVVIRGRVVALIELGAGLNPLLTACENIRLAAQLHGINRKRAAAMVPDVLAFAGLEDSADTVLQTFSTGMRARLAFGIAALLEADVLLVDEVLAVGDVAFQRKCLTYMKEFLARGGGLLLVSHAIAHVHAVCQRGILLDHGRVTAEGETQAIVRAYLAETERHETPFAPDDGATVAILALGFGEVAQSHAETGSTITLEMEIQMQMPDVVGIFPGFSLWTPDGMTCVSSVFDFAGRQLAPGRSTVRCKIDRLPLAPGPYILRPMIADSTAYALLPLGGPFGGGRSVTVNGPVDLATNAQMQMAQIVRLDSQWLTDTP
ncbi:ABC transporter ATP-binding protein [Sphingomonas immobilis]|uniref:ABC transporter ATP-binding protein n=1 Tax=Sphingomonas immobilis TaxID=3063997 RepID=A0ABT8ZXU4_9SPHN|nr:ABC transporter ATP-binding protein [Sphingomonas sp. CA1-15]MDO7841835.1 ABC transporter ATP-binding protein [Sphingomonas sp. CA1-15]